MGTFRGHTPLPWLYMCRQRRDCGVCTKRETRGACIFTSCPNFKGRRYPFCSTAWEFADSILLPFITEIVHLVCIGYAGRTLVRPRGLHFDEMLQQAANSLRAVHGLDVLHSDPIPGNISRDEGNGRVNFIDFERAIIQNNDTCHKGVIWPNKDYKSDPRSLVLTWESNLD